MQRFLTVVVICFTISVSTEDPVDAKVCSTDFECIADLNQTCVEDDSVGGCSCQPQGTNQTVCAIITEDGDGSVEGKIAYDMWSENDKKTDERFDKALNFMGRTIIVFILLAVVLPLCICLLVAAIVACVVWYVIRRDNMRREQRRQAAE